MRFDSNDIKARNLRFPRNYAGIMSPGIQEFNVPGITKKLQIILMRFSGNGLNNKDKATR
jgi:hypothetical protein